MARGKQPRKPLETFTAHIERLDNEGRGVARRDGKVVFVEGALPTEEVVYARLRNKPSFEIGRLQQVVGEESELRVTPACPYFGMGPGSCGGCAMQHIAPTAQVAFKQAVLLDALWHIGKVRPEMLLEPIYGPTWHYRCRARFTVRKVDKKGGVLVGFHEKSSSYVCDMKSCLVVPKKVSDLLVPLRDLVASLSMPDRVPQIEMTQAGERLALVFRVLLPPTNDDLAKIDAFCQAHGIDPWLQPKGPESCAPLHAQDEEALQITFPEFGVQIPFKPTDFTQVNHAMNEVMVSRAVRLLDLSPESKCADFFCGLGNFTLPIATRCARVIGLEGSEGLVARAARAARENGLQKKTDFVARNLFTWTMTDWDALWNRCGGLDRINIDPPREGALALVRTLAQTDKRPQRVVYVSCNPATLARDCAVLHHEGGWRLRAAGIMNMFPHTGHVESMAILEPGPKPKEKNEVMETQNPSSAQSSPAN